MVVNSNFDDLRTAYNGAFNRLRTEVSKYHSTNEANPEVRERINEAEVAYRETRDELANYLIASSSQNCGEPCCA